MRPQTLGPDKPQQRLRSDLTLFLGSRLKQQGPVLLLPPLHPVAVDVEGARVHQVADKPVLVGDVSNAGQRECLGGAAGLHLLKGMAAPHTVHSSLSV